MSDIYGMAIVLSISLAVLLVVYVFASFSYNISEDYLKMRRRILIYVPFSFLTIRIENIEEVRGFDLKKDLLTAVLIFGNVFRRKGVIVVLKRRFPFWKKIFITPENPQKFIEQINRLTALNPRINSTGTNRNLTRSSG